MQMSHELSHSNALSQETKIDLNINVSKPSIHKTFCTIMLTLENYLMMCSFQYESAPKQAAHSMCEARRRIHEKRKNEL